MEIGIKIKSLRREKGLNQGELAEKANISREAVGNYERGDRQPNIDITKRIAAALDVSVSELLGVGLSDGAMDSLKRFMDENEIFYPTEYLETLSEMIEAKILFVTVLRVARETISDIREYNKLKKKLSVDPQTWERPNLEEGEDKIKLSIRKDYLEMKITADKHNMEKHFIELIEAIGERDENGEHNEANG